MVYAIIVVARMSRNFARLANCTCFAIRNVERKADTFVKVHFTKFGGVKKMSQINIEQPHFPWIILVVTVISSVLLYRIALWGYEYFLWMWNNRAPSKKRHHHSKKSKKRAPSPSSSDDSDSDSSSD